MSAEQCGRRWRSSTGHLDGRHFLPPIIRGKVDVFQNTDRQSAAEPLLGEVLQTYRQTLGNKGTIIPTVSRSGVVLLRLGRPADAVPLILELFESDLGNSGKDHANTVGSLMRSRGDKRLSQLAPLALRCSARSAGGVCRRGDGDRDRRIRRMCPSCPAM